LEIHDINLRCLKVKGRFYICWTESVFKGCDCSFSVFFNVKEEDDVNHVLKRERSGDGSLFVCVCDDYLSDCEFVFKSQVVEHVKGFRYV